MDEFEHLSKIRGKRIDAVRTQQEQARAVAFADQLKALPQSDAWKNLPREQQNFKTVLSGESKISLSRTYVLGTEHLKDFFLTDSSRRALTIHRQYDTGRDLNKLYAEQPRERYKFYLSLDLSTPLKEVFAQEFSSNVVAMCREQGISLTSKSFDHDYDSWNLYTWEPQKLAVILKHLYSQFSDTDIFLDARHWMQGPLNGVPIKHIGWVQEPCSEGDAASHSVRMGRLGRALDNGKGYEEACKSAGVKPSSPWLLEE